MTTVDAKGYSCPEPVIMLRKAMMAKDNEYTVLVDNTASRENVTRYACLLYTSPSPRDKRQSRMPSSA